MILGIEWLSICVFWLLFIIKIWIGLFLFKKCVLGVGRFVIFFFIGLLIILVLVKVLGKVWKICLVILDSYWLVKLVIVFCLCSIIGIFSDYVVILLGLLIYLFILSIVFGCYFLM